MSSLSVQPNAAIAFKLLHADDDLAVVSKPSGLVTQPGKGHDHDSLLNGLFGRFGAQLQKLGASRDFGLLHRLDRDTSGLLIVALRPKAYDHLREAFERRVVGKYYWALVNGTPKMSSGVVRRPLLEVMARPASMRNQPRLPAMKLVRISSQGKPAVTAYRVLAASRAASLVECRTLTGRLHQIRVHMDSIGCPILGDVLYAPTSLHEAAPRLALHAHRLVIPHPDGRVLDCHAAWPGDLRGVLKRLKLEKPEGSDRVAFRAPGRVERDKEIDGDSIGDEHPGVAE